MSTVERRSEIVVRSVEGGDAAAVGELIVQLGYARPLEEVQRWIEELGGYAERQAVFVACEEDQVVGWVEVSLERRLQTAPFALVGGLVVRDGLRGKGIGRLLCEAAEQWTREHGAGVVRVTSRSTREAAHRFYLRDGYSQVKTSLVFEKRLQG